MRDHTIARNYAEALLALARKANDPHGWGQMLRQVADAVEQDTSLRLFLESPRVSASQKNEVLRKAFQDRTPRLFVRFLQQLVHNRRQMLIPEVAAEYFSLLDEAEGRVHAQVTVARSTDDAQRDTIARELSRVLGKQVVPHMTVNPAILGGVVVKVGDRVMDGSVRRRLASLRDRLVRGSLVRR
jgi:F-type H+-transporting ATPase subunit delta